MRKDVLNVSNIPAITQIVLNMEIVGQIEVIDKEEEYNNIEHNPLQKKKKAREKKNNEFEKESGQNQNNSDFRKKLLF